MYPHAFPLSDLKLVSFTLKVYTMIMYATIASHFHNDCYSYMLDSNYLGIISYLFLTLKPPFHLRHLLIIAAEFLNRVQHDKKRVFHMAALIRVASHADIYGTLFVWL